MGDQQIIDEFYKGRDFYYIANLYYMDCKKDRCKKKVLFDKQKEFIKNQKSINNKYKFTGEKVVVPKIVSKRKSLVIVEEIILKDYLKRYKR